jgi:excisionase family DNA binding protein
MGTIQFIQSSPQELQEAIVKAFSEQLESLKADFQPKEPTEYLTRPEVAEMLSINLSTLHNWVRDGKLQSYALSGRVYFKRAEVEQSITPLNF